MSGVKAWVPQGLIAGRYRVHRLLGRGGQAAVYLARDLANHEREVVLKTLASQAQESGARRDAVALFAQEPRVLQGLRHRCLPKFIEQFEVEGVPCFVVERKGTCNLEFLLSPGRPRLEEEELAWVAFGMLELLDYLHSLKPPVLLRDIKPSNITCDLDEAGRLSRTAGPWFVDLTIAQAYVSGQEDVLRMGTPGYTPPEQYRGRSEPASDLYALTATLFRLLTGHDPASTPFATPGLEIYRPDLGPAWRAFFARGLALQPQDRYPDARAMRDRLTRALEATASSSGTPSLIEPLLWMALGLLATCLALSWMCGDLWRGP